jgi:hypothetical protein
MARICSECSVLRQEFLLMPPNLMVVFFMNLACDIAFKLLVD